jgi:SagB-type dehydrogenase family enzyme
MTDGIGRQFMLETRYEYMEPSGQSQGTPQPLLELPHDPTHSLIELPAPDALSLPDMNLLDLITQRTTHRHYADAPLTLAELSFLLWCTQGIKLTDRARATRRTVPSAGARHAFETVLLVNNVTDLAPGLYRFLASMHHLIVLPAPEDIAARITEAGLQQNHIARSAVTFLWVAVVERMAWRYGERGYRYLHLDAGHVCQNLYLAAEAIGFGVGAIAAFNDAALNAVLDLDGDEQFVIYLATVGKKP